MCHGMDAGIYVPGYMVSAAPSLQPLHLTITIAFLVAIAITHSIHISLSSIPIIVLIRTVINIAIITISARVCYHVGHLC